MKQSSFAIILSGIAIFFGLVAIYTTRPYNWDLDFVGVIIVILTFLVTLLIGWNIFTALDLKKKLESMEKDVPKIKELKEGVEYQSRQIAEVAAVTGINVVQIYQDLRTRLKMNLKANFLTLSNTLYVIRQLSILQQFDQVDNYISAMEKDYTPIADKVEVTAKEKEQLLQIVANIPNQTNIPQMGKLLSIIASIPPVMSQGQKSTVKN